MKLTKIKLINWHIFTNETIKVNGNILITGENASGKSTLMDAIYFVLSGGDATHFNKAANEGGQRTLETYMRGKLGSERNPYLREQSDVISYIILEYKDEKKRHEMVLGVEMEIIASGNPKTHFFVINNYKIKDDDFIKDKKIIDYRSLKSSAKAMKYDFSELSDVKKERKRMLAKEIFKLEDHKRYFDLLQNAISFKPISEVSSFVNSFLLEEDNIELDTLKEEIRSYQNIHKMVIREKEKIEMLKDFTPKAEKYLLNTEELKYFSALKIEARIEKIKNNINKDKIDVKRLEDEYKQLDSKENTLRNNETQLNIEITQLRNNEEYKALQLKKENLNKENIILKDLNQKLNDFSFNLNNEQKLIRALNLNYRLDEDYKNHDFGLLLAHLENYSEKLGNIDDANRNERVNFLISKSKNEAIKEEKEKELDNLKKGINNYKDDVYNLIHIAKDAIMKANPKEKDPDVRPLCEYIEIKDEKWTNALEGYLNTRRFNLIFDPKYYDVVSKAYDKYKNERKVYLAGIVNVNAINEHKTLKNSLMNKIEIKNKFAYRYANYLLGDLICVDNVEELKNYESAITPDVMVYKNYVLKATNPEVYKVPFIGSESRKRRIEILNDEIKKIEEENKNITLKIIKIDENLSLIKKSKIESLLKAENYWALIEDKKVYIRELENEIKDDEKHKGLIEITIKIEKASTKLEKIKEDLRLIDTNKKETSTSIGTTNQKIKANEEQLVYENNSFNSACSILNTKKYDEYKEKYTFYNRINEESLQSDTNSALSYNNAVISSLLLTMQKYTSTYKASLTPIIENINDFVNEYYDLVNRGVVEYEHEAKEAYERAEISFKEDFIAKLKEKIEKSQAMLDKINKNLAMHPFGNDEEKYKFYYEPTKNSEFYNYYRIIMSGKLMASKDLFTEILDEKDYSFMQDLFGKISMEIDSEQAEAEVNRYLDYRNYMNYDIKITNKYGDESFFSKINKEKSGGETQTPFYIVMASCFDELMNKDNNKIESTCQVVFDEAFNNMDESRIKSLMEFYKKLNIQIVIIVPSNRISAIAPYMETLIGIAKVNNHPYIDTIYKNE